MSQTLEQIANGRKIILDTSSLSTTSFDLLGMLYEEIEGLDSINPETIKENIDRLGEIKSLDVNGRFVVIEEVYKEIETGLNLLNGHIKFIQKVNQNSGRTGLISAYRNYSRNRTPKKHNKLFRRGRRADEERAETMILDEDSEEILGLLRQYAKGIYTLLNSARKNNPVQEIKIKELSDFLPFFNLTRDLKPYIISEFSTNHKKDYEKPQGLGEELQTDEKIIASAFYLSAKNPIAILTRDNTLIEIARTIGAIIDNDKIKREYGITQKERFDILAYNPAIKNPSIKNPVLIY